MIKSLVISLILTIIIEILVSYILGVRKKEDFKLIILVNIYTNPVVVFISNIVQRLNDVIIFSFSIFILEVWAVIIEGLIYRKYLKEKINFVNLSILCNICSFGLGVILLYIYKEICV